MTPPRGSFSIRPVGTHAQHKGRTSKGAVRLARERDVDKTLADGGNEWTALGEVREIKRIPYRRWSEDPTIGENLRQQ